MNFFITIFFFSLCYSTPIQWRIYSIDGECLGQDSFANHACFIEETMSRIWTSLEEIYNR